MTAETKAETSATRIGAAIADVVKAVEAANDAGFEASVHVTFFRVPRAVFDAAEFIEGPDIDRQTHYGWVEGQPQPYWSRTLLRRPGVLLQIFTTEPPAGQQSCRGCQTPFPYDPEADYCPRCARENAGDDDGVEGMA